VQRVSDACVDVEGRRVAGIGRGLLVLLGVASGDSSRDAAWMADRVGGLRIFPDSTGKMNLSVRDVGGEVLAVSQFTLLGMPAGDAVPTLRVPLLRARPGPCSMSSCCGCGRAACPSRPASFRPICGWC